MIYNCYFHPLPLQNNILILSVYQAVGTLDSPWLRCAMIPLRQPCRWGAREFSLNEME